MKRRAQNLETRYRNLLRDAKVLTSTLEYAGKRLREVARQIDPNVAESAGEKAAPYTPTELRSVSMECERIVLDCGRRERRSSR